MGSFPGFASPSDMVNSKCIVVIKPGNSSVVIWYQVDEFTLTSSVEYLLLNHTFTLGRFEKCHTNQLSTWTRVWGIFFFGQSSWQLSMVLIPSLPSLSKHQNGIYPLMTLMLCLLQSFQGSYVQLVQFLIIVKCSLFLVSNLINYGARLGCYFACPTVGQSFSL